MEIFVRQIITAGIAHFTVYDGDLPVIPVIEEQIQKGLRRIEAAAPDPGFVQLCRIAPAGGADGAQVIIHQPHFHTLPGFPLQDLPDLPEGFPILQDEIFHENEGFRLFQIFFHIPQGIQCFAVIFDSRFAPNRHPLVFPEISGKVLLLQGQIPGDFRVFKEGRNFTLHALQALSDASGRIGQLSQKIQTQTHDGHGHHQHDPGQLKGRVGGVAVEFQHRKHRHEMGGSGDIG